MRRCHDPSCCVVFSVVLLLCISAPINAMAQSDGVPDATAEIQWQSGPSIGDLDEWAEVRVPEGYLFTGGENTRLLMEEMGNIASNREVGLLAPEFSSWFVVFEFDKVGYIRDDEKNSLDSNAILDSVRANTEEANKLRREKGFPGLTVLGWVVEPRYNEITHNLEWAIRAKDDDGNLIVNHNTRLLGRRGVMRVTLVVDPDELHTVLPVYRDRMGEFQFKSGQKYAEFSKGDKIAKYGLTALVAGGAGAAAAKFGLFKILGKYFKLIIIAVVAFLAGLWRKIAGLFSRGKYGEAEGAYEAIEYDDPWEENAQGEEDKLVCTGCDFEVDSEEFASSLLLCPECGSRLVEA